RKFAACPIAKLLAILLLCPTNQLRIESIANVEEATKRNIIAHYVSQDPLPKSRNTDGVRVRGNILANVVQYVRRYRFPKLGLRVGHSAGLTFFGEIRLRFRRFILPTSYCGLQLRLRWISFVLHDGA